MGDLAGWRQVFVEGFDQAVPEGQFPGRVYRSRWDVYADGTWDTTKRALQAPSQVLSVADGALRWRFRENADGTPLLATALPRLHGGHAYQGLVYGRFAVRFRSTKLAPGYSMVFLLWPDSDRWPDEGEIDFPAGELTDRQGIGYTYIPAEPTVLRDPFQSDLLVTSWHTAVTEWVPGAVRYFLDGKLIGTSTRSVPSTSLHWVLQTDTTEHGAPPAPGATASLEVDWAAAWAYAPGTPAAAGRLRVRAGTCSRGRATRVRQALALAYPAGTKRRVTTVAGRRSARSDRVDLRRHAGRTVRIRVRYERAGRRRTGCAWVRVAA